MYGCQLTSGVAAAVVAEIERLERTSRDTPAAPCGIVRRGHSPTVAMPHNGGEVNYFAFFHSLTGDIVPCGVLTSEPVVVMMSPLKLIFCARTTPSNTGLVACSTL